jgi:hypothetical protein
LDVPAINAMGLAFCSGFERVGNRVEMVFLDRPSDVG